MISDGCTVTGPILSQFWLPPTAVPNGDSTSSCSPNPTARIGRASRFQAATDIREATTRATAPTPANTAWLTKIA